MNVPLLYKAHNLFGIDIGHGTIKVVELEQSGSKKHVAGYGFTHFADTAINKEGVITNFDEVAQAVYSLLTDVLIGSVTTRRVAVALPVAHTFTRILSLPIMDSGDLANAVKLETEQYVPVPIDDLYLDYELAPLNVKQDDTEVLMVAASRRMIDSYITLCDMLGLEIGILEPTNTAIARAVGTSNPSKDPLIIVDFGSVSSDLTVYDRTIRVTSTIDGGSEAITHAIAKEFNLTPRQAHSIKTRFGLEKSKYQPQITRVVEPLLSSLIAEIKKLVHYYQERTEAKTEIKDIVILGGGANLPGLTEYLKAKTGLSVRLCNPWEGISFDHLQRPHPLETALYTTAVGLSLIRGDDL